LHKEQENSGCRGEVKRRDHGHLTELEGHGGRLASELSSVGSNNLKLYDAINWMFHNFLQIMLIEAAQSCKANARPATFPNLTAIPLDEVQPMLRPTVYSLSERVPPIILIVSMLKTAAWFW